MLLTERDILKRGLQNIGSKLVEATKAELLRQGHKSTGGLLNSVEFKMSEKNGDIEGMVLGFKYGIFVDQGVRKGVKLGRLYLEAIQQWAQREGIVSSEKEAVGFSHALRYVHQEEGIPTQAQRQKGKKLGWFTDTLEAQRKQIDTDMQTVAIQALETAIENTLAIEAEKFRKENPIIT